MDLGPLGKTTSKQTVHRSLLDCFTSISNWSLLFVAVLICKKNPARFIVLILTVAIYLVWMLIISRLNIGSVQKIYFLFIFDVSLFSLAFSVLLLPILKKLRPIIVFAIEVSLFIGIIGMHLLIYGKFWYRPRSVVLMIAPIAAFLIACKLTEIVLRKKKSMGGCVFIFTLSNLLSLFITLAASFVFLYVNEIINSYYVYPKYILCHDMKEAYLYLLIFYAVLIPFAVFVFKNRFYQNLLLENETKNEAN